MEKDKNSIDISNNSNNSNNLNNSNNIKERKDKSIKIAILALIIIIILIIVLVGFAYAKYVETYEGEATTQIAKMICEMDVVPSEANKSIINPYCKVTVKNYNVNNEVTETNIDYTIQVSPKDDFKLPEYYWQNSDGDIISRSNELTGNFKNGVKEETEYTIVFLNSGEEDIMEKVEFNIVAVQSIK